MPNIPHRAARQITAVSESCLMTLLMLPAFIAHALFAVVWRSYQGVIRRKLARPHACPGCPYCTTILDVRLPKDLHN